MNRGDLNRILNKLTAVVNVESFEGTTRPGQVMFTGNGISDLCESLKEFNFFDVIINTVSTPGIEPISSGGQTSTIFLKIVLENFMLFMHLFCECKRHLSGQYHASRAEEESELRIKLDLDLELARPWSPSIGLSPSVIENRLNAWNFQKQLLKKIFLKCEEYVKTLLSNPFLQSCGQFDYGEHIFPTDAELEAFRPFLPPALIDELTNSFESLYPANDPIAGRICAEPKVAIVEDYLVEQGLGIGVAGILAATALGLYLRGNRAAAVTLIATATAAVGGTATGAESVMNAVDTDYNRSVRFGGQQDCRDSNQTVTVGDGD